MKWKCITLALLIFLGISMAIDFAGTSQAFGNSDASPSISLTIPADCTFVLVCIGWYSPDSLPSSMAINGVAMTKEVAYEGWNVGDVQIWRLSNPSTGSQNLTWSWPSSPSLGAVLHVVYLKGVSASSPVRDSDYVSTGGPDLQIILTTQSGDRVIGFVVDSAVPDASPSGSGQTDILSNGPFNSAYGASAYEDATGASVTFTSSSTGGYHVLIGVALIPAAGNTYYESPANAFSSSPAVSMVGDVEAPAYATPIGLLLVLTRLEGNIYNESVPALVSTPACAPSTFLAISPSLAAFVSTPALGRAVVADLVGGVTLASAPSLSRAAAADFFSTLTLPSTPAASMMGGMDLFNALTLLSGPAASMAHNLGIFPSLTLLSNPVLSPSALADFYSALTLASTPAAVIAAIANFYNSLALASSPAWTAVGGSDFYNSVTFSSAPAISEAALREIFPSLTLASSPGFTAANIANLLNAINLSSNPALTPAAVLGILLAITVASDPAFSTAGGSDFYNAIALASNPALAAAVFKETFPSLSLASVPALSIAAQADLLASILAASSPALSTIGGFDLLEAIILASGGAFTLASELTSGPVVSIGMKRAAAGMVKRAIEAAAKKAPGALRRDS